MSETREAPPNDYRDPFWRDLIARTEERVDIPRGLLQSVVLFGEKSNNDQTNSNNTRTIFQIIPSTRDSFLRKYGVDAYLGPDQAAEVAALHLKESLQRNGGNLASAVGEYHGSPNRRTWGPRTNAYINSVMVGYNRLLNDQTAQNASQTEGGQSAVNLIEQNERALQSALQPRPERLRAVYETYRAGQMPQEDAQAFENDIRSGKITMERGATLLDGSPAISQTVAQASGAPRALPQEVLDAYTQGRMTVEERQLFERHAADGVIRLPEGFPLTRTATPAPSRQSLFGRRGEVSGQAQPAPSPGVPLPPPAAQPPQAPPQAPEAPFAAPVRGEYAAEGMAAGAAMPFTAPGAASAPQATAAPQAQPVVPPVAGPRTETTAAGLAGAATRGMALPAAGALAGGALALPTGVGVPFGAAMGATAGALVPIVGDPAVALINRQFGTNFMQPSQALNELLARAGIMEPATATERVVESAASTGAAGGAQVAAMGQLAARALTRDPNSLLARVYQSLATGPRAQVGAATGAGAGGQTAAEMGYGELGQAAGSLIGGLGGAGAGSVRVGVPARIAADVEAAKSVGVPVMTSDVSPPRTFMSNWLRRVGEAIPITGTGGPRAAQQQARVEATQNILRQHGANDTADAIADVSASVLAKREAQLQKYAGEKMSVINASSPNIPVPVNRTVAAIDIELAKPEMNTTVLAPVRRILENWRDDIQGKGLPAIETLRSVLGQAFKNDALADVRTAGEKIVTSLYGPLREDMGEFILQNQGRPAFNKFNVAMERLRVGVKELENDALKSILDRGEATPEIARRLLLSSNKSDVQLLYRNLTPAGQQRARAAILEDALSKSSTAGEINPTRFANELGKRGTAIGVMFNGRDLEEIQGLMRVLNITKRAQESSVVTSTGQMGVPFLGGSAIAGLGATFGGPLGGIASLGATALAGVAARAYESATSRNILTRISRAPAGSDMETRLVNQFNASFRDQAAAMSREVSQ
jgi:hypothetical protein